MLLTSFAFHPPPRCTRDATHEVASVLDRTATSCGVNPTPSLHVASKRRPAWGTTTLSIKAIEGVVQLEAERVKGRNECRAFLGRCRGHLSNYPERNVHFVHIAEIVREHCGRGQSSDKSVWKHNLCRGLQGSRLDSLRDMMDSLGKTHGLVPMWMSPPDPVTPIPAAPTRCPVTPRP